MGKAFLAILLFLCANTIYSSEINYVKLDGKSSFHLDTTGIPKNVLPAINYSFAMLDSIITSNIPIRVSIEFSKTSRSNVIATGEATSYETNFSDLAQNKYFYPISLAEKISGSEINSTDKADIHIVLNNNLSWHFGTTTNEIGAKFDFITLFTHEMIHGLGFQSMIKVLSNGADTSVTPSIFDSFITDKKGLHLYPYYFKKGPDAVKSLITCDSLYFWNNKLNSIWPNSNATLYAPKYYAPGNSIHHIRVSDDASTPKSIMRPAFRPGDYMRGIDPFTRGILLTLGWNRPNILLEKQYDVISINSSQDITLGVKMPINNIIVDYSFDQFNNYKSIVPEYSTDKYSATIPSLEFNHLVSYRIKYTDDLLGTVSIPCDSCSISYYVGDDTTHPTLTNFSISSIFVGTKTATVKYNAADNSGETDVCLIVSRNGKTIDSTWSSTNRIKTVQVEYTLPILNENDILKFKLIVQDRAKLKNQFISEKNVSVMQVGDICYSYTSDFEDSTTDFSLSGFQITKNIGFSSSSLNTAHPYIAPNKEQDTLFTYAILKPRIIIDQSHYFMSFDEIVLVEPCDAGKRFGEFGFWDFVTVEGSKDNGQSWHIIGKEGYNSSFNPMWQIDFLKNIVIDKKNKNSHTIATENMYVNHKFNLVENKYLQKGDTIMIRFKLTSDAFSTGWGWSIDNLKIQEGAGLKTESDDNVLEVYPNPFTSQIAFSEYFENAKFQIVTLTGECVKSGIINDSQINVNELTEGMYYMIVNVGGNTFTQRLAKIGR